MTKIKIKGKTFKAARCRALFGDCLKILPKLDPNSFDSGVMDPPYHLASIVKRFGEDGAAPAKIGKTGAFNRASRGFMGKKWDGGDVAFKASTWKAVLRVLKPGAFLVAFGIPKNSHRLKCAIEDAGFEVRDDLLWLFGSGFPKARNVAREIEKTLCKRSKGEFVYLDDGEKMRREPPFRHPEAEAWFGWSTALKPAYEHVILARKPMNKTLVENVRKWGTGALNIDAGRVQTEDDLKGGAYSVMAKPRGKQVAMAGGALKNGSIEFRRSSGRWPANVMHDGSGEVTGLFPETGLSSGGKGKASQKSALAGRVYGEYSGEALGQNAGGLGDSGSASRFFYSAKADSDDRAGSGHPTIKPVDVIRYLCRLITPPGGKILDAFAGTGTTGEAAFYEGFSSVLIERDADAQSDIARRMRLAFAGPQERRREIIKATGKLQSDPGPLFAMGNDHVETPR